MNAFFQHDTLITVVRRPVFFLLVLRLDFLYVATRLKTSGALITQFIPMINHSQTPLRFPRRPAPTLDHTQCLLILHTCFMLQYTNIHQSLLTRTCTPQLSYPQFPPTQQSALILRLLTTRCTQK